MKKGFKLCLVYAYFLYGKLGMYSQQYRKKANFTGYYREEGKDYRVTVE